MDCGTLFLVRVIVVRADFNGSYCFFGVRSMLANVRYFFLIRCLEVI